MRQLHQIRADTAAFARVMRAEAARMRLFEEGLERELQEAEHEVKVHKHIADEMGLEAAQVFGPAAWDSSAAGNMLRAQAQRDAALPTEVTKTFARRLHWRDLAYYQLDGAATTVRATVTQTLTQTRVPTVVTRYLLPS